MEPGLAPGLWPWIGPGWARTWFAEGGACAGLPQRGLLATGYPNPSTRKFWKSSFFEALLRGCFGEQRDPQLSGGTATTRRPW